MQPNSQTANVLADNEAPYANALGYGKIKEDTKEMRSKAFSLLMSLSNEERIAILSKYAERYGWYEFT